MASEAEAESRASSGRGAGSALYLRGLVVLALALGAGAVGVTMASSLDDAHIAAGVVAGGLELGGLDERDARARLEQLAASFSSRELRLVVDGRELRVASAEAGVALDVDATLAAASAAGTRSGFAAALEALGRRRHDVALAVRLDPSSVDELGQSCESVLEGAMPVDGGLELHGGEPVAVLPKKGRRVDRDLLATRLSEVLARGELGPVEVPLVEVEPALDAAAVEAALLRARSILAGPIVLRHEPTPEELELADKEIAEAKAREKEEAKRASFRLPKSKSRMRRKGKRMVEEEVARAPLPKRPETITVEFSKADLLAAFRTEIVQGPEPRLLVALDDAEVKKKLAPVVAQLYDAARDARFDIDAQDRVTIVPSRPGTRVDSARLVEALWRAAESPERSGLLPVDREAPPQFTTEEAEALGIKGLVSQYTTHHPCCQPRVKNIHRIASMLDGMIVKRGQTLSVNQVVGPRTLARGFVLAPSIGDGEMVDTPGGGVSQFATTMFNALFDGGYVVKERQPHSFYFHRYPMGIEATLSFPSPDLVFYNDTPSAVLVRCEYGETFIRVKLFGDNGGRRVDRKVSRPFDYTDPKIEYLPNPDRDPEKEKVKEPGQNGFSVDVARTVHLPDGEKREEKRRIRYKARPRVVEVHPCKIPEGEKGHTGEKCPKKEEDEESEELAGRSDAASSP